MKRKTGFGWCELIVGLLLIGLGIFTFVSPGSMLTGAVVIYGIIAVVMGIEDIVLYARISRFTGFGPVLSLISGILSVMCGVMLLANPDLGKWALTILFPLWFIAHCISGLTHISPIRAMVNPFYYYFSMTLDIIGIVLGIFMVFSPMMSFLTIKTVCYVAAAYLVLFGIESIVSAFMRRSSKW